MSLDQVVTDVKKKKKKQPKKTSHSGIQAEASDTVINGDIAVEKSSFERKPLHTSMELLQVAPVTSRKAAGSNWKVKIEANSVCEDKQTVDEPFEEDCDNVENISGKTLSKAARLRQKRKSAQFNKYVSMDCEMVGVGFNGQEDMLARVSIVNKNGEVLLDKFVKAREAVIDYRTSVSGIRPHDIDNGEDFKKVQEEVLQLIQGKVLVGHAIRNDLAVLHIKHPYVNIRDTSRYKPLSRLVANGRTPSLKRLSQAILGLEIQTGEHNSVEDARAAMKIYNRLCKDWEIYIKKHQHKNSK